MEHQMSAGESSQPSPLPVEAVVRSQVESLLAAKLAEYKRIAWAFLTGFGLIFAILTANRLISENSLLVYLHDELFGTERGLGPAINHSVALSYSNQFVLKPATTPVQFLTFYANETQTVTALIEIKHHGNSTPNRIIIRLDRLSEPIWNGTDDMDFSRRDLTMKIRQPAEFSPAAEHMHNLTFQFDPAAPENDQDETHVQVIVNVIGLEEKPK